MVIDDELWRVECYKDISTLKLLSMDMNISDDTEGWQMIVNYGS